MFRYENNALSIKETTNAVYEKFTSKREYFRKIITFDEKNIGHERGEVQGVLHYQLWQSIQEPWIFLFYTDISDLDVEEFVTKANKNNPDKITVNKYTNWLQEEQRRLFRILIEGEQLPVFVTPHIGSNDPLIPHLKNDPFNDFKAFMGSNPLACDLLTMYGPNKQGKTEMSYKGLILNLNQAQRLAFHALKHPEQYVKETIAESIDLLLASFKDDLKT